VSANHILDKLVAIDTGKIVTVLVIEDDVAICEAMKAYLENEKCIVFTAGSAVEAIIKLKLLAEAHHPTFILSDIQLPLNGENVISAMEKLDFIKDVPIIPMSAGGKSTISGKKVMAKPFHVDELLKRIRGAIEQSSKLNGHPHAKHTEIPGLPF
jgi:DNA-binding response OmpR family regulator